MLQKHCASLQLRGGGEEGEEEEEEIREGSNNNKNKKLQEEEEARRRVKHLTKLLERPGKDDYKDIHHKDRY